MFNVNSPDYQKDLEHASTYITGEVFAGQKKIKVLIIGASGLIGSFLTDTFVYYNKNIAEKIEIYAMGRSLLRLKKRFDYIRSNEVFFWEHDIQKPFETEIEFDYIFHLASNADPASYAKYPVETISTNVLGSMNVIQYAKKHIKTKIVFTSSMEVYGENDGELLKETDYRSIDWNQLRAGYPESKRVSELLYRSAFAEYEIQSVIVRLGYIYGPTMTESDNKVVAQFIRSILDDKDIVLESAGTQRRTYCYVADAVIGILHSLFKGLPGEVYNVADKNSLVTIRELGEIVARLGRRNVYVNDFEQKEIRLKKDVVLDSGKLEKLGWSAEYDIENGVIRTIAIMK